MSNTVTRVNFTSTGPKADIQIDGALWTPTDPLTDKVCVLVHPWGILGGSQGNTSSYAEILSSKFGTQCLTFDLRGVGRSSGSSTFRCANEVEDVIAACDWVKRTLNKPIVLVGSSAGAAIAGSAIDRVPHVAAYVGIGYTFGWMASIMFGSHFNAIMESIKPKLFIMGTKDEFTSVSQLESRVMKMQAARSNLVQGVGHFELENSKYAVITSEAIAKFIEQLK